MWGAVSARGALFERRKRAPVDSDDSHSDDDGLDEIQSKFLPTLGTMSGRNELDSGIFHVLWTLHKRGGQLRKKNGSLKRILKLSKPELPALLIASVFLVLAAVSELAIPKFTTQALVAVTIDNDEQAFKRACMYCIILAVLCGLFTGLRGSIFSYANNRLVCRLRKLLFKSLLEQDIAFFDQEETGQLTSRITADCTAVSNVLGLNMNVLLRSLLQVLGGIGFLFYLSWNLTMVTLIAHLAIGTISTAYGRFVQGNQKKVQTCIAEANHVAEEALGLIRVVRSFSTERFEYQRFGAKVRATLRLMDKQALLYLLYCFLLYTVNYGIVTLVLFYGGLLVLKGDGEMTGGKLTTFVYYAQFVSTASGAIGDQFTAIMQAIGASEKVFELIDRTAEMDLRVGTGLKPEWNGEVELQDVKFLYKSRPHIRVLKGLSLRLEPGKIVALVGPSGGGKSTIVSLLNRFYDPTLGRVMLTDTIGLSEVDLEWFHGKLGVVSQEPQLFDSTIEENIAYGMEEYTAAEVEHAAKQANAHNFIRGLPEGYQTKVGEKGVQLSGGQKQRLAIARALIRNPQLLILDEATSALDTESERLVQDALDRAMQNRTVLVIAHRLSTVQHADKICVISDGMIAEEGTHTQLIRKRGQYYRLVQKQLYQLDDG